MTLKIDDKVWRTLRAKLNKLGARKSHVRVGVFSGVTEEGVALSEILAIHEYGAPGANIPARKPIRSAFRDHRAEYARFLAKVAKSVISGKVSVTQALNQVGLWGATAVKRQILGKNLPPPLRPQTIARKGSSKPLVDTGQLVNAITWQVKS